MATRRQEDREKRRGVNGSSGDGGGKEGKDGRENSDLDLLMIYAQRLYAALASW